MTKKVIKCGSKICLTAADVGIKKQMEYYEILCVCESSVRAFTEGKK